MKKIFMMITSMLCFALLLSGCTTKQTKQDDSLAIVATTTMLADLTKIIGGEHVSVEGLMGPGIDPHLYQASAGDVTRMQNADIVVYNGLHLEGKMSELFEKLTDSGRTVISIEKGLNSSMLLNAADAPNVHDPHIWFDVALWKQAAKAVADGLKSADSEHASSYEDNLKNYLEELDQLDAYIRNRIAELPKEQRVLITAHDAFSYFGHAYEFEVKGLQGISTEAEAGTYDVSNLAQFIVERKIKAIFVESSVPTKTIEALQAAVKAKGFDVSIGGELYSDSIGGIGTNEDTYIAAFQANVDTIVDALK